MNIINPQNSEKEIVNSNFIADHKNNKTDQKLLSNEVLNKEENEVANEINTFEETSNKTELNPSQNENTKISNEISKNENDKKNEETIKNDDKSEKGTLFENIDEKANLVLKKENQNNEENESKFCKDEVLSLASSCHNAQLKNSMALNDIIFLELQNFYNLIKVRFNYNVEILISLFFLRGR